MPLYHTLTIRAIRGDLNHLATIITHSTVLNLVHLALWTLLHKHL